MKAALRRAGWLLAFAIAATLLASFVRQPVSFLLTLAILIYAIASAWRPFDGLRVLAALSPIATVLLTSWRGSAGTINYVEVLLLSFLCGWTLRQAVTGEPLRVPAGARVAATLLLVAALCSATVSAAVMRIEMQELSNSTFAQMYVRDYILHLAGGYTIVSAVTLAGGLMALLAAAHLTHGDASRRSSVLRLLLAGAAAAAAFNLLRIVEVTGRREGPRLWTFLDVLTTQRANVHYVDRNAAGSYFAMMLLMTGAVAARSRVLVAICAPMIAAGLWITGSRVALASAIVVAAVAAVVASRHWRVRTTTKVLIALLILTVGATIWIWYPAGRNFAAGKALGIRMELAKAGVQMAREHPAFGVGLGRFYELSDRYAADALQTMGFTRENAHNNFIQILAELGVPGFILFIWLIVSCGRQALDGADEGQWLLAGIAAYLLTCLSGHPLLVIDAALPFWIVLGLSGGAGTVDTTGQPRLMRVFPIAAAAVLVISVAPRASAALRHADLEHVSAGFSKWQRDENAARYRWMGGRATFYVTASASGVAIPVRQPGTRTSIVEVTIRLDGREVNRILVPPVDEWQVLRIVMPRIEDRNFVRVDLAVGNPGGPPFDEEASEGGGLLMVGRPAIQP